MTAPKRRWLRWSLGTLFIALPVLAIWLGWALHQVRERDKMLRNPLIKSIAATDNRSGYYVPRGSIGRLPTSWRLMGAKPMDVLVCSFGGFGFNPAAPNQPSLRRVRELFPEADVRVENNLPRTAFQPWKEFDGLEVKFDKCFPEDEPLEPLPLAN